MSTPLTLREKEIVVGVSGSIAAVEMVKFLHALRRRGASVHVVMSRAATSIIHPDALTYASGNEVIVRLSGRVEHVTFCGDEGSADLFVIAPCTANTLGKVAHGIDDTTVTTFASTAMGSGIPVIIVPAMHYSMYRHPAVIENIERLKRWGVHVVDPKIEEGKAKIAGTDEIVLWCERAVMEKHLGGKRVLITSGPCREPVDDVRVLTTRSTGEMGRMIALQAFRLGAEVTVIHSATFPCVKNVFAETAQQMHDQVINYLDTNGADIYISSAAISDFAPKKIKGKIPSGSTYRIDLSPLPKLLDKVMATYTPLTIAFKLGWETETKAKQLLKKGAALVVTNTPEAMGSKSGEFILMTEYGRRVIEGTKGEVAAAIWDEVIKQSKKHP